jgi:hypothetical protein
MSTGDHQRTSRKKDRTSSTNNAGCSNAAKWPPLAGSFQYRMFGNRRSAHRRDGRCSYRAITRMSDSARERHFALGSFSPGLAEVFGEFGQSRKHPCVQSIG